MRIKNPKREELKHTTLKALFIFSQTKKFNSIKELTYSFFNQARMKKAKLGFPINSPDKFYQNILQYARRERLILSLTE